MTDAKVTAAIVDGRLKVHVDLINEKHQAGQHDQLTHGSGGGGGDKEANRAAALKSHKEKEEHSAWQPLVMNNPEFKEETFDVFNDQVKSQEAAQDIVTKICDRLGLSEAKIEFVDTLDGAHGVYRAPSREGQDSRILVKPSGQTVVTIVHEVAHHVERDLLGVEHKQGIPMHGPRFNKAMRLASDAYLAETGFKIKLNEWMKDLKARQASRQAARS